MRVGIIGAGAAGGAIANGLAISGTASEIVLVDQSQDLAEAQASDIRHASALLGGASLRAGGFESLVDCAVCVIAAGVQPHPGETRAEHVERSSVILDHVLPLLNHHAPDAVLLVASRPSDALTLIATRLADRAAGRVIGCGTILDSMRFTELLARLLEVPADEVTAYVIGEHGDSQVLCWTGVEVEGMPLADWLERRDLAIARKTVLAIDDAVRRATYRIQDGKGTARYGVAGAVCRIVRAIARDEQVALTVSMLDDDMPGVGPVALSLPRLIGARGIADTATPVMSDVERRALHRSATIIREGLPPAWRARRG